MQRRVCVGLGTLKGERTANLRKHGLICIIIMYNFLYNFTNGWLCQNWSSWFAQVLVISGVALLRAAEIFLLFENARADLHGSLFSRQRSSLPGASIPIVPLRQPCPFLFLELRYVGFFNFSRTLADVRITL